MSDQEFNDVRHLYEQAEAQRKLAQLNLDRTRIHAPFSGRVAERFVDLGQHVAVGSALFSLVDPDPLLARIYLPEREASRIAPGQGVVVTMDARPDLDLQGEVLRIAPIVDRRTGTVKVTCQLRGLGERLRPGSFVRVRVQTDLHPDVLVVPKRALVPEGGETYVFKVVADSVIKESVRTGYSDDRYVEILGGLRASTKEWSRWVRAA
jgi:RND family efflux transporter MFP subunit